MSEIDFVGVDRSFVGDVEVRALFAGANPMWQAPTTISATGGTITDIIVDGYRYKLHSFTANGDFVVSSGEGKVEVLLVGAGGGGGSGKGGGGGGGGVIQGQSVGVLKANTYPMVVGLAGTANTNQKGGTGGSSSGFGLLAYGGGGGAYQNGGGAKTGGCNGGCGAQGGTIGLGGAQDAPPYKGQGNLGGQAMYHTTFNSRGAGGGGGVGGVGSVGGVNIGGAGGPGIELNFTGANVYYGAGGGGAAQGTRGAGGTGGGGAAGNSTVTPSAGSGVGAGGGGSNANTQISAAGANGAVYVRYRTADYNKYLLKAVIKFGGVGGVPLSNTFINDLENSIINSTAVYLTDMAGSNTGIVYFGTTDGPNDNSTLGSGVNVSGETSPEATFKGNLACAEITQESWYAYYPYTVSHSLRGLKPFQKYLISFIGTRAAITTLRTTVLTPADPAMGDAVSYDISQYPREVFVEWTADAEGNLDWDQTNGDGASYSYLAGMMIWEIERYEPFQGSWHKVLFDANSWIELPDSTATQELTIAFRMKVNDVATNISIMPGLKFFFSYGAQRLFANMYTTSFSSYINQVSHATSEGVNTYNETTSTGRSYDEGDVISVLASFSVTGGLTGGRTASIWVNGEQVLGAAYPSVSGNIVANTIFMSDDVGGGANTASGHVQALWFSRELVDPYLHWDKFFDEKGRWVVEEDNGTVAGVTPMVYIHGNASLWNAGTNISGGPAFTMSGDDVIDVP